MSKTKASESWIYKFGMFLVLSAIMNTVFMVGLKVGGANFPWGLCIIPIMCSVVWWLTVSAAVFFFIFLGFFNEELENEKKKEKESKEPLPENNNLP